MTHDELISLLPRPTGTAVTPTGETGIYKFSRLYDLEYYYFYGMVVLQEEIDVISEDFISLERVKERFEGDEYKKDFIFLEYEGEIYMYDTFQDEIHIKRKDRVQYFGNIKMNRLLGNIGLSEQLDEILKKKLTKFLTFA